MAGETLVIALGGNAIKQSHQLGTTDEQFSNVDVTARQIGRIVQSGYRVVVTHGNGPQAGALLIQQEEGEPDIPAQTLAVCGAMTQGQIGWMLQNRLNYYLQRNGLNTRSCSVITQVTVSENDPDFQNPSKPVGPFYTHEEAQELTQSRGYLVKEVKPGAVKGWRRVVPSPEPIEIVEKDVINHLIEKGCLIIASGGGGIPVKANGDGSLAGVEAVIDKDRAGFKLAQAVNADIFMILTDVSQVCLYYNSPEEKKLDHLSVEDAEKYLEEGHFLAGSMGPKVEAAARFARWSGKEAIITALDQAVDALKGKAGTHIRAV